MEGPRLPPPEDKGRRSLGSSEETTLLGLSPSLGKGLRGAQSCLFTMDPHPYPLQPESVGTGFKQLLVAICQLGEVIYLSEPQFPRLQSGDSNSVYLQGYCED